MKVVSALCLSLFLFTLGAVPAGAADVAVDAAGNTYSVGYSGSPIFSHYVTKHSPSGQLIFQHYLDLPRRYPFAIAVDPAGHYIYIAGIANFGEGSEASAEYNMIFIARLTPDGTGIVYETFYGGSYPDVIDLAVDALGRAYLHYSSYGMDYNSYRTVVMFSPEGLEIGGYIGSSTWVITMALGPAGDLFTVGWMPPYYSGSDNWGLYLERMNSPSGTLIFATLLDDQGLLSDVLDIAATPGNGAVVVGMKSGGLYVAEFGPAGEELFSRILDVGAVEGFNVAVTSSGEIVINVYRRSGNTVLRLEGGTGEIILPNRPPVCSGATASPSVIWPPNGKMVPVSILGVTDPEGKTVAVKVTGITQDEPGAAFSGIGSSVAQVRAERDGKGDGRVYRLAFEAADPAGALCTGAVTVCVPHDQGKGNCVDSNR